MASPTNTWQNWAMSRFVRGVAHLSSGLWPTNQDDTLDIPSRDLGRTIRAHLYHSKTKTDGSTPVLINAHGSGFCIPLHGSDDEYARRVTQDTPYTVIDTSYRLAPEHPWPAAINDMEDVIRWAMSQKDRFDSSRIALSGFSAGASLALAVCHDRFPRDAFTQIIAVYPASEMVSVPGTRKAPDPSGRPIPVWLARYFDSSYIPPGVDPKEPTISALYAPLDKFTNKLTFVTTSFDTLTPATEQLADKLSKLPGKDVKLRRFEGVKHAWDKYPRSKGSHEEKAVEEELVFLMSRLNEA